MNKVTELENALTELFRKGTEVGYSETEIDEFLEDIDYDTLLQAAWNNAETVYSYRADGEHEFSMDYRGTELFKQRATLLYEDTAHKSRTVLTQLVLNFSLRQNKSGGRFFALRLVDFFNLLDFGGNVGIEET